jgi:hypothetical protein
MPAVTDLPIWTEDGFEIRTQGTVDTTAATYTYNGSLQSYIFRNDGAGSITLTIGGKAITVVSGEMVAGGTLSSFTVQASSGTASWTMRAFESGLPSDANPSSSVSPLFTLHSNTLSLSNGLEIDISGYSTLYVRIGISIPTGTAVTFEGAIDTSLTWYPLSGVTGLGVVASTATTTSDYRINVSGFKFFRARVSAYVAGPVYVTAYASTNGSINTLANVQAYGTSDANSATSLIQGVGAFNLLYNGSDWARQRTANQYADGNTGSTLPAFALLANNGTSFDRVRTAADGMSTGTLATQPVLWGGSSYNRQYSAGAIGDAHGGASIATQAGYGYGGTTGFDRMRVGKIYKWIEFINLADATATTVWTPAAGRKFRLMGLQISTSAAATVHLRDGAGGTRFHSQRTGGADTKDFNFGNGYLSATANNVLEILNSSGSTINVWVTAWGTEE